MAVAAEPSLLAICLLCVRLFLAVPTSHARQQPTHLARSFAPHRHPRHTPRLRRYHACNPTAFKSAEAAYLLAYALLLLNAQIHGNSRNHRRSARGNGKSAKQAQLARARRAAARMSFDQFSHLVSEQHLPQALVEKMYRSVVGCDLFIEERAHLDIVKHGWLLKRSANRLGWHWRYVILSTRALYVSKLEEDNLPYACVSLSQAEVTVQPIGGSAKPRVFAVVPRRVRGRRLSASQVQQSFGSLSSIDVALTAASARDEDETGTGADGSDDGDEEAGLEEYVFKARSVEEARAWLVAVAQFTSSSIPHAHGVMIVPIRALEAWERHQLKRGR